jgi:hypothetical protein
MSETGRRGCCGDVIALLQRQGVNANTADSSRPSPRLPAWLLAGAALVVLVSLLLAADLDGAAALLRRAGPWLLLAPLPWLCNASLDAAGSVAVFGRLGARPGFLRILRARLAADGIAASLPGGALVAESLGPLLLRRSAGIDTPTGVAGQAGRKWLQTGSQAVYLGAAALLGHALLARLSPRLGMGPALPWLVLGAVLLPLGASLAVRMLFGGARLTRLHGLLSRLPGGLGARLAEKRRGFARADTELARLASAPLSFVLRAGGLWLASWCFDTLESWMLLRLLGVSIDPLTVLAFDAALSLLRTLSFFAPAGLGVQDAGYLAVLRALAVPGADAVGPAFVLLKRGKELVWICVGWALVVALGGRSSEGGSPGLTLDPTTGEAAT